MLIEFSTKNFRSIKEKQTLSLVSSKGSELQDTNTMPILKGNLNLLRSTAIYGPNASGKTSLILALKTMKTIVLRSAQSQRGDKLSVTPYLLDRTTRSQPTEFSVIFISNDVRYEYGFSATEERIWEEWLFAYPKGQPQTWINRVFNSDTGQYEWGNTEKLTGAKQLWRDATRSNALFLSTAIQLNNTQLQPVFDWFETKLRIVRGDLSPGFTLENCQTIEEKARILDFLQAADFHIHDLEITTESVELDKFLEDVPMLRMQTVERLRAIGTNEIKRFDVKSIHLGVQNDPVQLDMDEESSGTQKFFSYAGPWLDVLKNGYVLVVDELSNNLHPKLVKYMVQMFHNPVLNPHNAQLIFTTHETSILSQEMFRRDQIWFTEKDEYNATILYPLSDFSPRKGVENLEKSYLQGRYGALPFLQDITGQYGEVE